MTIRIKKDRIEFDGYTLYETSDGFFFNGQITGCQIQDSFQGTVAGFAAAGYTPGGTATNVVERFSFGSELNACCVGILGTCGMGNSATASSSEHGYQVSYGFTPCTTQCTRIERYPFSGGGFTSTFVGCLTSLNQILTSGQSSRTHGYSSGGWIGPAAQTQSIQIHKFSFSSCGNSICVGNLSCCRQGLSGQSSSTHGYASAGYCVSPSVSGLMLGLIDKFPFATDSPAICVGCLAVNIGERSIGISSSDAGFTAGGLNSPWRNEVLKFPFASESSGVDLGDLTVCNSEAAGMSAVSNGYVAGGKNNPNPSSFLSSVEKFPYSSPFVTTTTIANLTSGRYSPGGTQD